MHRNFVIFNIIPDSPDRCRFHRPPADSRASRATSGRRWRWLIGARATTLLRKKHVNFLSRRNLGNSDVGHYLT